MSRTAPSTSDQVIDSRDVIERIEELEGEREALTEAVASAQEAVDGQEKADDVDETTQEETLEEAEAALLEWTEGDEGQELKALLALQDEAEGYAGDWKYGATLIREDYFPDYCQELVSDIGDLPKDIPGYLVIDWDKTADNLRVDYTEVNFDGTTYLVR